MILFKLARAAPFGKVERASMFERRQKLNVDLHFSFDFCDSDFVQLSLFLKLYFEQRNNKRSLEPT